ncbi:hypothetical protein KTD17_05110 [Burkholderia multivorans]|uniref:hypothetical protein n=1 Tax=Burkholderia multivorans TaxID=87883 RepID=UPI001C24ADB1|nr:hypothetical protein [Burkholderia multivorans]MBU9132376.1 hypothetical protein [Burkholderia multivorans]
MTTPDRYTKLLGEYDAMLDYACAMSDRLADHRVGARHLAYAETIFTKLVCHGVSLKKLCPTLSPSHELWDIGAICAVARTLIEAFDALAYISLQPVLPAQRELRLLAWELHSHERRLVMLDGIGASGPEVEAVRTAANSLREAVMAHALYTELPSGAKKRIESRDAPDMLLSQRELNSSCGVCHDFYAVVTRFLSQYVHTHPLALNQLALTHAGDPGALHLIALAVQYATAFLAKAIEGIGSLWPDVRVDMSGDLERDYVVWLRLVQKGVKGITL